METTSAAFYHVTAGRLSPEKFYFSYLLSTVGIFPPQPSHLLKSRESLAGVLAVPLLHDPFIILSQVVRREAAKPPRGLKSLAW
jgi:hypothetical protein